MIMFVGGRGSGKTRHCIEFSARTRIPILCQSPRYVKASAKEYGVDIPDPISYNEYVRGRRRALGSRHTVIIDELESFLNSLGLLPEYVTVDETGNYIIRDEKKGAN